MIRVLSCASASSASLTGAPFNAVLTRLVSSARLAGVVISAGRSFARERLHAVGVGFDAVNSNTFQDQPAQPLSYKFCSLSHSQKAVRDQAVAHNVECIELGEKLGSKALTVWIADGSNFPGQSPL